VLVKPDTKSSSRIDEDDNADTALTSKLKQTRNNFNRFFFATTHPYLKILYIISEFTESNGAIHYGDDPNLSTDDQLNSYAEK